MKSYFLDLIPKLQRFSQKIDDSTRLTSQHWVVIDETKNSKDVFIFRGNNELLISHNGKVEKAKWEYLGHNSLLIDQQESSYLFKHGFLDDNLLVLKIDSKEEYVFLVSESKIVELNTVNKIGDFLTKQYLEPTDNSKMSKNDDPIKKSTNDIKKPLIQNESNHQFRSVWIDTNKGKIEIQTNLSIGYTYGDKVLIDGEPAPDGKYVTGWPSWLNYITIKDGKLIGL